MVGSRSMMKRRPCNDACGTRNCQCARRSRKRVSAVDLRCMTVKAETAVRWLTWDGPLFPRLHLVIVVAAPAFFAYICRTYDYTYQHIPSRDERPQHADAAGRGAEQTRDKARKFLLPTMHGQLERKDATPGADLLNTCTSLPRERNLDSSHGLSGGLARYEDGTRLLSP